MNSLILKTKLYQKTDNYKSVFQVLNTFIPYFGLWYLITLSKFFLVTLVIATILALLSVRIFIILHDCGHQSFFTNKKIESIVGFVCGVFAFTSAKYWSYLHDLHHAFNGNLDRPYDYSDIYMMTKAEYDQAPLFKKIGYRIYRNPFFFLLIMAPFQFLILHRLYYPNSVQNKRLATKLKTHLLFTNLGLLLWFMVGIFVFKIHFFVYIQLYIMWLASMIAYWTVYVHHQFSNRYMKKNDEWDFVDSAMLGSSYIQLPKVFQWFTGNIGFHHIHHLNTKIPNYFLEKCYQENPDFQKVTTFTFLSSFKLFGLKFWDQKLGKMIGY